MRCGEWARLSSVLACSLGAIFGRADSVLFASRAPAQRHGGEQRRRHARRPAESRPRSSNLVVAQTTTISMPSDFHP